MEYPDPMIHMKPLETLYAVCPDTGCWLWKGGLDPDGYGRISASRAAGRSRLAHRYVYETHKEMIPEGLVIDHLCRRPSCVNPDHLEAVTQGMNMKRGNSPTHHAHRAGMCVSGRHELTPDNVYLQPGGRRCRACDLDRHKKYRT